MNIPYNPFYDFDLIADLKAVKANLNNQPIRNFNLSLDLINDVFYIKDGKNFISLEDNKLNIIVEIDNDK